MQSFVCGTRLCFGADAPAALAGLHAERVLLVTDPYFAENGTAARYAAAFPGGSGCGCSASVLCGPLLSRMERGELRRLLFCGTGALLSPLSTQQGESIPAVCHAVVLERS